MNHEARRRRYDKRQNRKALDELYERFEGICQLCMKPCTREDASRDHIKDFALCTPEEAADPANLQLAHLICNNLRHQQRKAKQRVVRDSHGRPHLGFNLGALFPELTQAMFGESDEQSVISPVISTGSRETA